MSKFKKKGSGELPKISTASLPDIVFMLLFFFMVATVLRDNTLMIQNTLPVYHILLWILMQLQHLDHLSLSNSIQSPLRNHPQYHCGAWEYTPRSTMIFPLQNSSYVTAMAFLQLCNEPW